MLGGIEGRRRRGWQRMRRLDGIPDSMDVNLSELREMVMDRDTMIHGVTKSQTRLSNWTKLNWTDGHFIFDKRGKNMQWRKDNLFNNGAGKLYSSFQLGSVVQLCPTLCDPMDCSTPGLPVLHHFQEFTQTHVPWVGDAIKPSHPLLSLSPPAFNLAQYQGFFKWVSSSYQVAKAFEFQLHNQSFQWKPRTDLL